MKTLMEMIGKNGLKKRTNKVTKAQKDAMASAMGNLSIKNNTGSKDGKNSKDIQKKNTDDKKKLTDND